MSNVPNVDKKKIEYRKHTKNVFPLLLCFIIFNKCLMNDHTYIYFKIIVATI